MVFVGVDPGLTGAVAVILPSGAVELHDTPVMEVKVGKALKKEMDPAACALMISALAQAYRDDLVVTIEKVAPMPSFNRDKAGNAEDSPRAMGVTSSFNFGKGFGMWIGIVASCLVPYQLVHPATWKSKIMKDMGKTKDASRMRAMQLYPMTASRLARKKDNGRADALLLAHFGRITYTDRTAVAESQYDAALF